MKKREGIHNKKANQMGVTLVTLVITIIVLLILAGVSLNGIFGESGLINNAQKAKENAEIAEEMELIGQATIIALAKSKTGTIEVEEMKMAMNSVASERNVTVIDNVETIVVKFNDNERYYTTDDNSNVVGPIKIVKDEHAGDLTKGGQQTGTEEKPFIINCIEDLVAFSIMTNGGDSELGLNSNVFSGKHVVLARNLDFNSMFSYNDYSSKKYGDLNGDEIVENIRTELIKQGDLCVGFTPIKSFSGTFNGQNYKICNLYENRGSSNAGLFLSNGGTIKNLGLMNITLSGSQYIGGIVAYTGNSSKVLNCFVEGTSTIEDISGSTTVGLIVGIGRTDSVLIEECYSVGDLKLEKDTGYFGGIVGWLDGKKHEVKKCYNIMEINVNCSVGGIIGIANVVTIEECFHIGNISTSSSSAGGICCDQSWISAGVIKNCYNIGNVSASSKAGGIQASNKGDIFNCYNVGKVQVGSGYGGCILYQNAGYHVINSFGRRGDAGTLSEGTLEKNQIISYLIKSNSTSSGHGTNAIIGEGCEILTDDEMKEQSFVDKLNILVEADSAGTITEPIEQNVWKMDTEGINGGYPIFSWQ